MSKNTEIISNKDFGNVRIKEVDGDLWFVAKDIAKALEYSDNSIKQLNNLLKLVPDIWKGHKPIMTLKGKQTLLCISEQGLYFFLGRSDKPKALPFQMWLAGEVIPSIRKTGKYEHKSHGKSWDEINIKSKNLDSDLLDIKYDSIKKEVTMIKQYMKEIGTTPYNIAKAIEDVYKRELGGNPIKNLSKQVYKDIHSMYLNPTEIGEALAIPMSAIEVNKLLAKHKYQKKDKNNGKWIPLGKGNQYSAMFDYIDENNDTHYQLKWHFDIIDVIDNWLI